MRENDTMTNAAIRRKTPIGKGFQRIIPLKALEFCSDCTHCRSIWI